MSYFNKSSNNMNTSVVNRKKKEEQRRKEYKDNKGNWEYSFFQKKFNPEEESAIKVSMRPDNGFNPKNVHQYISPEISKEEKIELKVKNGESLKSNEKIIYDNYIKKRDDAIKSDIEALKSFGLNAKPQTNEGRTRLLLKALNVQNKDL